MRRRGLPWLCALLLVGALLAHADERRAGRPVSFEDWPFWYHVNAERLEGLAAPARRILPDGQTAALHARLLETLRALVDAARGSEPWLEAAACRALGRAGGAEDVARLARLLEARGVDQLVAEGAALGLGLLRRSDASQRLPAAVLDRARLRLLGTLTDRGEPERLRGFAALALGLLSDQGPGAGGAPPHAVTEALAAALGDPGPTGDVGLAALWALACHPRTDVPDDVVSRVRAVAFPGKETASSFLQPTRAWALWALGRLGGPEDLDALDVLLSSRRGVTPNDVRSAALALGALAARADEATRGRIEAVVLARRERTKDVTARNLLLVALADAQGEDAAAARPAGRPRGLRELLEVAERGRYVERPFAWLALATWLRRLGEDAGPLCAEVLALLRAVEASPREDAQSRSAALLALGIAGDAGSTARLAAAAGDGGRSQAERGYALLGLALARTAAPAHALARRVASEGAGETLDLLALRALGILGEGADAETVTFLRDRLASARGLAPAVESALALARTGLPEAAEALLATASDTGASYPARTAALDGLGRMLDPERVPSLARLTDGVPYRARTDLVEALLALP